MKQPQTGILKSPLLLLRTGFVVLLLLGFTNCNDNPAPCESRYAVFPIEYKSNFLKDAISKKNEVLVQAIEKMGNIRKMDSTASGLQFRIYWWSNNHQKDRIFVMDQSDSIWSARYMFFSADLTELQDSMKVVVRESKKLINSMSYRSIIDSLERLSFFYLPNATAIKGYDQEAGDLSIQISCLINGKISDIQYAEPILNQNKFPEAKRLLNAVAFLNEVFGLDKADCNQ